jgi:hypothetical protein
MTARTPLERAVHHLRETVLTVEGRDGYSAYLKLEIGPVIDSTYTEPDDTFQYCNLKINGQLVGYVKAFNDGRVMYINAAIKVIGRCTL